MKILYTLLLSTLVTMLWGQARQWDQVLKKGFPKKIDEALGGAVYVRGGTFNMGMMDDGIEEYPKYPWPDTTLISIPMYARRITVARYFMGSTEVTNEQYREFVHWVRDSIAHAFLGHTRESSGEEGIDWEQELDWGPGGELDELYVRDGEMGTPRTLDPRRLVYASGRYKDNPLPIYPDTLCWVRDFSYSYNEPMTRNYFWHPAFDEYPIVGVSWQQAQAYCDWKTMQVNKLLAEEGLPPIGVRLPTEAEWEYAALALSTEKYSRDERITDRKIYPWPGYDLRDENGTYRANFGAIWDQTGQMIKGYPEGDWVWDIKKAPKRGEKQKEYARKNAGGLYTNPVGSHQAYGGLYDMAGNVSEWVQDLATPIGETTLRDVETNDINPFRGNVFEEVEVRDTTPPKVVEKEYPRYKDSVDYIMMKADSIEFMRYMFDQGRDPVNDVVRMSLDDEFVVYVPDYQKRWRDVKLIYRSGVTKRIGKGGSWAESHIYMMSGARAAYTEQYGYSFVGFRITFTPPNFDE